jgi:hypothetical protein
MHSTAVRFLSLVALLPACAGLPEAPPPAGQPEAEIAIEFDSLCGDLRDSDNPYYGTAALRDHEAWIAQPVDNAFAQALARGRLGAELLREGRSAEAATRLDEALTIARDARLDSPVVLDLLRRSALAHLRRGEQENCVAHHAAASCILPLESGGLHQAPEGSTAALDRYLAYMQLDPADPVVTWLANLAAMTLDRFPEAIPPGWRLDPGVFESGADFPRFVDRAAERGLQVARPSGGAVVDDFSGDGNLDVVMSSIDPCAPLSFFRNDGQGRFSDATPGSGLENQLGGLNLIHADYDNDGDLDLFVLRGGWFGADGQMRNSLLRNEGGGRFVDVTRALGLAEPALPTQTAAWGDYDNDGDLDLYIGNEAAEDLYAGGVGAVQAYPSQLFRNDESNGFVDVARGSGVTNDRFAKGVTWGDYDNDGDLDLYVSNIGANRLYRNEFPRGFVDVAEVAGVVEPDGRSFATWFFDVDNDGWQDLFVADYSATTEQLAAFFLGVDSDDVGRPHLYVNQRNGQFEERGAAMGLTDPVLPMGANFGDLDNDGWLDFYLGTGTPSFESLFPNRMYRNHAGERFDDVTYAGGFGHLQKGHGVAFADVDADGDQDVIEQIGGAYPGDAYPSVYFENPGFGRNWLVLELEGRRSNRSGLGSRVAVTIHDADGSRRTLHRVVGSGGSFGGSGFALHVGLGEATVIEEVEVRWLGSGKRQVFDGMGPNAAYRLVEGEQEVQRLVR